MEGKLQDIPVPHWPLDSGLEPDDLFIICRPQANPDPDPSHVSNPLCSLNKTHPVMISHGPPAIALTNGQVIPDAQTTTTANKAKQRPNQRKRLKFPMKGVSYLFGRSKRCLHCNYQFWMRRKWEKVKFLLQKSKSKSQTTVGSNLLGLSWCPNPKPKRRANITNPFPCPGPTPGCSHKKGLKLKNHISSSDRNSKAQQLQKHTGEFQRCHLQIPEQLQERKSLGSGSLGIQGGSEDRLHNETSPQNPCKAARSTELCTTTNLLQSHAAHGTIGVGITDEKMPEKTLSSRHGKEWSFQKLGEPPGSEDQFGTINSLHDQNANRDISEGISSKRTHMKMVPCQTPVSHTFLIKHIHEFLDGFYRIYGSFIPLQTEDVLRHLKMSNIDFNQRKNFVSSEVRKYQASLVQRPALPSFRVAYKKHLLTLDDLSTLEDQNWLNDQVINMYGELIMDSAHNKVHFFNTFFHRQLVTKGYEGVKRWTKQVDLFSNSLLLVPIHLDVHWCLVTGDTVRKRIRLYDSQGNVFTEVAMNILKYLVTEAKRRQQSAFQSGWTVSNDERIPQQTNENDCGVFILEYCRCLALGKHLRFKQVDIPIIRKRIYKELCGCKLQE